MANTKKKRKGNARNISFSADANACLDWLKKEGENFSEIVEEAFRETSKFKKFMEKRKKNGN